MGMGMGCSLSCHLPNRPRIPFDIGPASPASQPVRAEVAEAAEAHPLQTPPVVSEWRAGGNLSGRLDSQQMGQSQRPHGVKVVHADSPGPCRRDGASGQWGFRSDGECYLYMATWLHVQGRGEAED